jgi:alanine racemase
MDEAVELRRMFPTAKIVLMGVMNPSDGNVAVRENIMPVLVSEDHATAIVERLQGCGPGKIGKNCRFPPIQCHIKVDTGMGRLGFLWEKAPERILRVSRHGALLIHGICTHLASPVRGRKSCADEQCRRFQYVVDECARRGLEIPFRHMANSGGMQSNASWDWNGVRVGIMMYGYGHLPARGRALPGSRPVATRPVLQWKSRVLQVRDVPKGFRVSYDGTYITPRRTRLAAVDVGYADGYSRALSDCGIMLVGGRRCPVRGRVTMNVVMVDIGRDLLTKPGDEVVLIGQQNDATIWADELARLAGTIPYEILTSIRTDARS